VPRVHNSVQMGLRGVDESLFPIIAQRLLDKSRLAIEAMRHWSQGPLQSLLRIVKKEAF
jgi:hypothetical protein